MAAHGIFQTGWQLTVASTGYFAIFSSMKRVYCIFVENCSQKRELATGRVYADLATAIADLKKLVATGRYPEAGISPVEVAGDERNDRC